MKYTLSLLLPILAVRTNMPIDQIKATTTLDELELDSLGLADSMIGAEEAFGVDIMDADVSNVLTVGDLSALIESKL